LIAKPEFPMRRYVIFVAMLLAGGSTGFAQSASNTPAPGSPPVQSPAAAPQTPASAPPMRFEWVREGTADKCAGTCREWISASGQIQGDTPRQFVEFMKARSVAGAAVVLDSSGGSVGGAIVLGRLFRQADVTTTVGRTQKLPADADSKERIILTPQGVCASMCAFTLLGGKRRHVPVGARVLVHQIWPRVNANDPMAGNYTAKDLVGLQRELGVLAKYTIDMGGDIELFEIALRIPPWENLKPLDLVDIERLGLKNIEDPFNPNSRAIVPPVAVAVPNNRPLDVMDQAWAGNDAYGPHAFSRRHPLTVEGVQIGSFELSFVCSDAGVNAVYVEQRKTREAAPYDKVARVGLGAGKERALLKVQTSVAQSGSSEVRTVAQGRVGTEFLTALSDTAGQSLVVATQSEANVRTTIRPGNTGFADSFRQNIADCKK
jgi:hypothetical protein